LGAQSEGCCLRLLHLREGSDGRAAWTFLWAVSIDGFDYLIFFKSVDGPMGHTLFIHSPVHSPSFDITSSLFSDVRHFLCNRTTFLNCSVLVVGFLNFSTFLIAFYPLLLQTFPLSNSSVTLLTKSIL